MLIYAQFLHCKVVAPKCHLTLFSKSQSGLKMWCVVIGLNVMQYDVIPPHPLVCMINTGSGSSTLIHTCMQLCLHTRCPSSPTPSYCFLPQQLPWHLSRPAVPNITVTRTCAFAWEWMSACVSTYDESCTCIFSPVNVLQPLKMVICCC